MPQGAPVTYSACVLGKVTLLSGVSVSKWEEISESTGGLPVGAIAAGCCAARATVIGRRGGVPCRRLVGSPSGARADQARVEG